jgi:squalene cyclase
MLAARDSWTRLRRRRWWSAGWGYNRLVPPDADSTVWALRLAERLGSNGWRSDRALRGLRSYAHDNGSLSTYAFDGAIRRFTRIEPRISFSGWCGEHTCVTAAAASLRHFDGSDHAAEYLRGAQTAAGSWIGYWWHDHAFPTALAVEALSQRGDSGSIARARIWAAQRLGTIGAAECAVTRSASPFATACCVHILAHAETGETSSSLTRAIHWLIDNQHATGSWSASAPLRIPPPDVTAPEAFSSWSRESRGAASIRFDQVAVFTTATVLRALALVSARWGTT